LSITDRSAGEATIMGTFRAALQESTRVQQKISEQDISALTQLVKQLISTLSSGGKILLFGNGGSAADAQHVAAELVGRYRSDRAALPAIALTTDSSILTSIGNDVAFDHIFARQVQALARPGDAVVGISTSGQSENVLNGIRAAKSLNLVTIGFTGADGGQLRSLVDYCFCAPASRTDRIQEAHIVVWHAICENLERELFGQ
jgi:D-sedoheptulose 7-phosphate isomerase